MPSGVTTLCYLASAKKALLMATGSSSPLDSIELLSFFFLSVLSYSKGAMLETLPITAFIAVLNRTKCY